MGYSHPHTRLGPTPRRRRRRGQATLWIIVAAPAMLALLVLVTDTGKLWLARVELENAVEAGALAGAMVWGDGGDTPENRTAAHNAAKAFVEANTVSGQPITVDANTANTCPGDVLLGTISNGSFTVAGADAVAANGRACRVAASVKLSSFWLGFAGPYRVHASAVARYENVSARLVRVDLGDVPCN